jgi:hypothetical protein
LHFYCILGYGNVVPATASGKALVFTAGFLSIIAFTALIAQAGYIINTIVDDFFIKKRMVYLTQGYMSILFWLMLFVCWVFIFAAMATEQWLDNRFANEQPRYLDKVWFSYVTLTTVGFGDIFIAPVDFRFYDMFYLPFMALVGFVVLGNFGRKLCSELTKTWPIDRTLEDSLKEEREKL